MITATEPQELISECGEWRQHLVRHREELNALKNNLYQWASGKTEHDILREIEHYHNQFHIQLINVHDLKHAIREHIHQVEHHPNFGHKIPHHHLEDQYNLLTRDLEQLKRDFRNFISS
ncbi:MAG: hypothetical protein ABIX01_00335 [Chitinophagaceae bacterium]